MESFNRSTFMGATVIDFDLSNNNDNNQVPMWLRNVLDRALTVTGLKTKKILLTEEAIDSLVELDDKSLIDKECPICFETYDIVSNKNELDEETDKKKKKRRIMSEEKYEKLMKEDVEILRQLKNHYREFALEPMKEKIQFDDPYLFMPTDEVGFFYSRFPVKNLSTLAPVTLDKEFPGFDDSKIFDEFQKNDNKQSSRIHMPVLMPGCNHVFGKSCIIKWFKNNVSCPLCRKEVEIIVEKDPQKKKIDFINNNSTFNFTNKSEIVNHILKCSTDIFNPYRRPFNPSVTSLTDSYTPHNWATFNTNTFNRKRSYFNDPNLIMPRRYPLLDSRNQSMPLRSRLIFPENNLLAIYNSSDNNDNNDVNNFTFSPTNRTSNRVHFSPHTTNIDGINNSGSVDNFEETSNSFGSDTPEQNEVADNQNNTPENVSNPVTTQNHSGSNSFSALSTENNASLHRDSSNNNRNTERARRSNQNNRSHPYARHSSEND